MVVQFLDLPLDLLPFILQHILKPFHLAAISLVNRSFHTFAVPTLYERALIFAWHKNGKAKVIRLFRTLSECPHLARYVRRLEIRDFPKALTVADGDVILRLCLSGLANCVNLESATWTRDGSVSSEVLEALQNCPNLRTLEINGHHNGSFEPCILPQFTKLRKLSLIMPSTGVISILPAWIHVTGSTLRSLTLICKTSPIITDDLLQSLAPDLTCIEHLHLAGCPKVTDRGIWALLSTNISGIVGLGLEGLSPRFDMEEFSRRCSQSDVLAQLRSITLTVHPHTPLKTWMQTVVNLISAAPLEVFQIYSSGPAFEALLPDSFWSQIVTTHGARLKRLSAHRMHMSMEAIDDICCRCTVLEQLFVVAAQNALNEFGLCLSKARKLRAVHVNFPLERDTNAIPMLLYHDAQALIRKCGPTITQFGCNTRVWQVDRVVTVQDDGQIRVEAQLSPYESPDVPEQFLVARA